MLTCIIFIMFVWVVFEGTDKPPILLLVRTRWKIFMNKDTHQIKNWKLKTSTLLFIWLHCLSMSTMSPMTLEAGGFPPLCWQRLPDEWWNVFNSSTVRNSTGLCFDNSENILSLCSRKPHICNFPKIENNWWIHIGSHALHPPSPSTANDSIICDMIGFLWQLCSPSTLISSDMIGINLGWGCTLCVCECVCSLYLYDSVAFIVLVRVCFYMFRPWMFVTGDSTGVQNLISFHIIS